MQLVCPICPICLKCASHREVKIAPVAGLAAFVLPGLCTPTVP